jgi:hypothetical protein
MHIDPAMALHRLKKTGHASTPLFADGTPYMEI